MDFLALIQDPKTGVGAVLAVWLLLERRERLNLQKERDLLLERCLKAMSDSSVGLTAARDAILNALRSTK